jgi:hypothetical protein
MADCGDMYRFGNPSQSSAAAPFTTLAGTATNPSAVTLIVQKPDGTKLHYGWPVAGVDGVLTNESAGRFFADILIDQSGTWRFRLQGTGAVSAASEGTLRVERQKVTP